MSATTPDVMPGIRDEHYGCRVAELGEDSEDFAIAGHVPDRRALAAVRRYLRIDADVSRDDLAELRWARVRRRYVHPSYDADGELHWTWSDQPADGRAPVTLVEL